MSYDRLLQRMLILSSVLALGSAAATASDEADPRKEETFHRIYQQYNLRPTNEENWKGVLSGKTHTYGVQEGDTLWDLSEALFGDANFWPKVWSINNGKIQNPHQIFPGQTVHFTAGSSGEAPSVKVTDAEEPDEESDEAEEKVEAKNEPPPEPEKVVERKIKDPKERDLISKADIPKEKKTKPPTKIPTSLPTWTYGRIKGDLVFEASQIDRRFPLPAEPLSYYIEPHHPNAVGTVSETELGLTTVGEYQYLYVKLPNGANEKTLLAVKDMGPVKDLNEKTEAVMVQVQGEIEVLEKVNDQENVYRAIAKRLVNPIEVGSILIPGGMPTYSGRDEGQVGTAASHIIGGTTASPRAIYAAQNLVFLSGEGLVAGQTYPIFKRQASRNEKTNIVQNTRQIGKLKVVRVADRYATAVVLHSEEEVRVGDSTSR